MSPGIHRHLSYNSIRTAVWLFAFTTVALHGACYGSYDGTVLEKHRDVGPYSSSPLSIQEADQFIKQVFTSTNVEQYEKAIEAYISILQRIDEPQEEEEKAIITRHMRALALVMEDDERITLGIDIEKDDIAFLDGFSSGIEQHLIRWWRLQDVIPATSFNDRLAEHLQRVVTAWTDYALPNDPRGFDDRGAIYIRLGEPAIKTNIRLFSTDLQLNGGGLRVPPNEFWVYHHVAYDAHYLFTRSSKKAGYTISTAMDLIPKRLQIGRRNTETLLLWMEEVYGQLAVHHNIYGLLYDEVSSYITLPGRNSGPADVFARSVTHNARIEDQQLVWQRSQNVPTLYSSRFGSAVPLYVPFRWARFLERDGRTRLEVYWSLNPDDLKPKRRFVRQMYKEGHVPSDEYLVSIYSSLRDIELTQPDVVERHYLTDAEATDKLPVRSLSVFSDSPLFNLVLHWEQRWTLPPQAEGQSMLPGTLVKYHSEIMDSVEALHAQGTSLEVSDLKVLDFKEGILPDEAAPYPYQSLSDTTEIALYFEVYNLAFGSDDQTSYTISYEVNSDKEKRGSGTRASTSHIGGSRSTQEYIIPDLRDEDVSAGVGDRTDHQGRFDGGAGSALRAICGKQMIPVS